MLMCVVESMPLTHVAVQALFPTRVWRLVHVDVKPEEREKHEQRVIGLIQVSTPNYTSEFDGEVIVLCCIVLNHHVSLWTRD